MTEATYGNGRRDTRGRETVDEDGGGRGERHMFMDNGGWRVCAGLEGPNDLVQAKCGDQRLQLMLHSRLRVTV